MSRYEYEVSKVIAGHDHPFYALIMAAMRQADTGNLVALKRGFPRTYEELRARYNAPGGVAPRRGERRGGRDRLFPQVRPTSKV